MHILVSACLKHPPSAWCAACRAEGRMLHLTALSGRHASTRVRCQSSKLGPQRGGCMRRHRMSFGDFSHAREAQKAPGLARPGARDEDRAARHGQGGGSARLQRPRGRHQRHLPPRRAAHRRSPPAGGPYHPKHIRIRHAVIDMCFHSSMRFRGALQVSQQTQSAFAWPARGYSGRTLGSEIRACQLVVS